MTRLITMQAETVEKAVEQALAMLELTLDDVHIEVTQPAGTSLFGFKKVPAEVKVTQIPKEEIAREASTLRIYNGQLETQFNEQSNPIVIPSAGVNLIINDVKTDHRTILLPTDLIVCQAVTEHLAAQFVIKLEENDVIAKACVTPGKKVTHTLADSSWETVLNIQTTEKTQVINELQAENFVEKLKALGIENGLCMDAIEKAADTLEAKEFVVAKGIPPVHSKDASLEEHLNFDKEEAEGHERVDYREHNPIPTVQKGQLIATYIPSVPGTDGKSLLGEVLNVRPPKEIIMRAGHHVENFQNKIYAKIDGRPVIEWRGNLVKIEVNREYRHPDDVNLQSGNIYFDGDVWIGGSVHPSMFVAASGIIQIMKNSTKASIRGTKSVFIQGSIFSSTVTVGIQEKIIGMLVKDLQEVLDYLRNIESALRQIFTLRGELPEEVPPFTLKQAIHLLLEQKYSDFTEVNKQFIQVVKNHSQRLDKEWVALSERLYLLFVDPLREEQTTITYLRHLIEEAEVLLQIYSEEIRPESVLQASFALNSILYSNGNIHILSKGVYNCSITALHDIVIKGVCRGGEVIGGRNITLDETGSSAGVKTTIQTAAAGVVKIGTAHPGTVLQIGNQKHEFFNLRKDVTAKLGSEGTIVIT
ncbi:MULTISPECIES: flagellar assembly protein A [unclassified Sporosarcina]|uniref:flagellar assembly protein A n=1 Tax=unclassified Sporosarcina TaxID=2647733 RepID=UPI00203F4854|nr:MULTISPECIES: flagellar assembly protein A [unclassified Sporosarcina]GKV64795.1 hypothetical protein NCCP2331_09480 [Sporosarcina sp. NCCP-2331]GLB54905.1 hypothetical protein NCCP2378_06900 [Sporosarcina sp. NCCP-2378]